MARFITIGYGDDEGYAATPEPLRAAAHEHDARLQAAGAIAGIAGEPVQVRNTEDAGTEVTAGSFLRSDLPLAGFGLIEADDLEAAIALAAGTPCAVNHGVVEVWPLLDGPPA